MVGDSMDDMVAGYKAGAATVLLACKENEGLVEHECTGVAIGRLDELVGMLEEGFEEREREGEGEGVKNGAGLEG